MSVCERSKPLYPSGEVRSIYKAGLVAIGQHLLHGRHVVPHPGSLVVGKMPNYNSSTSRDSTVSPGRQRIPRRSCEEVLQNREAPPSVASHIGALHSTRPRLLTKPKEHQLISGTLQLSYSCFLAGVAHCLVEDLKSRAAMDDPISDFKLPAHQTMSGGWTDSPHL